jgi:hypothetical protein
MITLYMLVRTSAAAWRRRRGACMHHAAATARRRHVRLRRVHVGVVCSTCVEGSCHASSLMPGSSSLLSIDRLVKSSTVKRGGTGTQQELGTPVMEFHLHACRLPAPVVADLPPAVGTLKRYSKVLEYEYRVKTTLKRYFILSLTLYLEWYSAYSIVSSGGPIS